MVQRMKILEHKRMGNFKVPNDNKKVEKRGGKSNHFKKRPNSKNTQDNH